MRIFVTGATGMIGAAFCHEAMRHGHEIMAFRRERSPNPFSQEEEKNIYWLTYDNHINKNVASFKPDILFHSAWGGVKKNSREDECAQSANVELSRFFFQLYPYRQIIALGSQAEYGFYNTRIDEKYPLRPFDAYGETKVKVCEMLKGYASHLEWQWLRIFSIFGEQQRSGIIPYTIESCLSEQDSMDTTLGEQVYSFLYVKDFARAMMSVLGVEGKSGIYNISQPRNEHSIREVMSLIKKITRSTIDMHFGALPYRKGQTMLMSGDVTKFEKAFGEIPSTPFELALKNVVESMR